MIDIPCIILAGGKSSRMGEDKCFLPFKETTLIEYQYNRLSKIFKTVYISSKTNKFNFDCNIIYDNNTNISSPMVALASILQTLKNNKVFIITVDIPFVKETTILELLSVDFDTVIAKDNEKIHNLCGIFHRSSLSIIKQLLQKDIHKINYLLKQLNNIKYLEFKDKNQFLNINNHDDYKLSIS